MTAEDEIRLLTDRVERLCSVVAALEALVVMSLDLNEMDYARAQALLSLSDYTEPLKLAVGRPYPGAMATEKLHQIRETAERMKRLRTG